MAAGIIKQKRGEYALRLVGDCGAFTAEQLQAVGEIARAYGNGVVFATSRGTFETNGLAEGSLGPAGEAAKRGGLRAGGSGPTVRAVVACKGTECTHGQFDVHALARELDAAFYGQSVPKKFKIGVFGCLNSLGKAQGQDLGILPSLRERGKFDLFLGGMMGKTPCFGLPLGLPLAREQLAPAVALLLGEYRRLGLPKERFRAMLDRQPPGYLEQLRSRIRAL